MGEHPTVDEVRAFTQGACGMETARELVTHLLRGCSLCREETVRQSRMGKSAVTVPVTPVSYDAAFERAVVHKLPRTGMAAGGRGVEGVSARAARPALRAEPPR